MSVAPAHYRHPVDKAATEKLEAIPLFNPAMRAFMRVYNDRQDRARLLANGIRLGSDQLPEIYNLLPPLCLRLGVDVPELYLVQSPASFAQARGDAQIVIILSSGLVELSDEAELRTALAREVGHIACRHALYRTFYFFLKDISHQAALIGPKLVLDIMILAGRPLAWGINYWVRQAEFSADRAAALLTGGADDVLKLIAREAAGPLELTERLDLREFIKQSEEFDALTHSTWTELLVNMELLYRGKPLPATRAREIERWCASDEFQYLLQRLDDHDPAGDCRSCGKETHANWKFCIHCGAPLRP